MKFNNGGKKKMTNTYNPFGKDIRFIDSNAQKINNGDDQLYYSDAFQFYDIQNEEDIFHAAYLERLRGIGRRCPLHSDLPADVQS